MSIFATKYHGSDVASGQNGRSWEASAEEQLRALARDQAKTIRNLEADVKRLKRELDRTTKQLEELSNAATATA